MKKCVVCLRTKKKSDDSYVCDECAERLLKSKPSLVSLVKMFFLRRVDERD